jgi:CBS domain-containing protein
MAVCREVMTPEPACCHTSDSIVRVAQLMKSADVGAVPVIESSSNPKLVGMVTDRDIVVKGVAAGRSVNDATVKEVMTTDIVTCREDDDVTKAVAQMAERKVRRMPVVDGSGLLRGIIAQADIATRVHQDKTTGALVEAISAPGALRR